jgi:sec-independent protein translocase protein TatA
MEFSLPHILILLLVVILVFSGGKKIPELMKGLGQGIREFKEGMRGDQPPTNPPPSNTTTTATNAPPPPAPEQKS